MSYELIMKKIYEPVMEIDFTVPVYETEEDTYKTIICRRFYEEM